VDDQTCPTSMGWELKDDHSQNPSPAGSHCLGHETCKEAPDTRITSDLGRASRTWSQKILPAHQIKSYPMPGPKYQPAGPSDDKLMPYQNFFANFRLPPDNRWYPSYTSRTYTKCPRRAPPLSRMKIERKHFLGTYITL